jgi:hypothetical protein
MHEAHKHSKNALRYTGGSLDDQSIAKFNSSSDYSAVVFTLSMGSAKKKPMTKKEREERRKRHKEKRLKK